MTDKERELLNRRFRGTPAEATAREILSAPKDRAAELAAALVERMPPSAPSTHVKPADVSPADRGIACAALMSLLARGFLPPIGMAARVTLERELAKFLATHRLAAGHDMGERYRRAMGVISDVLATHGAASALLDEYVANGGRK